MKKILVIIPLIVGLNLTANEFKISEVSMAESNQKFRTLSSLKMEQEEVSMILRKMEELQHMLIGYSEKQIIDNLRTHFSNKYHIQNTDIVPIKMKLNQALNSINKEE